MSTAERPLPGIMPDRLPENATPPPDFEPKALGKSLLRVDALMHTGAACPVVHSSTPMKEAIEVRTTSEVVRANIASLRRAVGG